MILIVFHRAVHIVNNLATARGGLEVGGCSCVVGMACLQQCTHTYIDEHGKSVMCGQSKPPKKTFVINNGGQKRNREDNMASSVNDVLKKAEKVFRKVIP